MTRVSFAFISLKLRTERVEKVAASMFDLFMGEQADQS